MLKQHCSVARCLTKNAAKITVYVVNIVSIENSQQTKGYSFPVHFVECLPKEISKEICIEAVDACFYSSRASQNVASVELLRTLLSAETAREQHATRLADVLMHQDICYRTNTYRQNAAYRSQASGLSSRSIKASSASWGVIRPLSSRST